VMAVSLGQVPAPAATLAFLESVSSEIRQVGTEAIRGTPTTHYAVTIEAKQALERQGLTERQRKRMAQALAGANLDSFPADVWIDGGDRLRKLHFRVEPDGKDGVQSETTLELFDFGGPPAVEPPPADQVLPISDTEAFFPGQDLEKTRKEFEERIQEFLNKAPKNSPSG
jgi:hypothetical protein